MLLSESTPCEGCSNYRACIGKPSAERRTLGCSRLEALGIADRVSTQTGLGIPQAEALKSMVNVWKRGGSGKFWVSQDGQDWKIVNSRNEAAPYVVAYARVILKSQK